MWEDSHPNVMWRIGRKNSLFGYLTGIQYLTQFRAQLMASAGKMPRGSYSCQGQNDTSDGLAVENSNLRCLGPSDPGTSLVGTVSVVAGHIIVRNAIISRTVVSRTIIYHAVIVRRHVAILEHDNLTVLDNCNDSVI